MGYYTRYEYSAIGFIKPDVWDEIEKYIDNHEDMQYALADGESCKWYEHDKDMKEMSLKFPDVLFQLRGEGEENGDMWINYYKNGKMQQCEAKITFEPYDESKLK